MLGTLVFYELPYIHFEGHNKSEQVPLSRIASLS